MEHPLPLHASTDFLTGPRLVGIVLNWYLHGLLTVQYILYLVKSPKDPPILKFTVHFLFVLVSTQAVLTMVDAFFWFVYNFGNPTKLFQFNLASIDIPSIDAIIGFVVQAVYCWRIWKLSQWRIASALTFLVALVTAVCGITAGVRDFIAKGGFARNPGERFPLKVWFIGSALTDFIIASSMMYILLKSRRSATEAKSLLARKITRILTLTLETNAITAAVAIGTVVIFFTKSLAPPRTFFNEPGGYILGQLYSNCFMVLLNQRHCYSSTSEKNEFTVELGTVLDYSFEGDARSAGGIGSNNRTTGANGSQTCRQLAPAKPDTTPLSGVDFPRA